MRTQTVVVTTLARFATVARFLLIQTRAAVFNINNIRPIMNSIPTFGIGAGELPSMPSNLLARSRWAIPRMQQHQGARP